MTKKIIIKKVTQAELLFSFRLLYNQIILYNPEEEYKISFIYNIQKSKSDLQYLTITSFTISFIHKLH